MEAFIVVAVVVAIIFILVKGGRKLENRDVKTMHDAELIKYKAQFEHRAHLSIKSGNNEKYEFYTNKARELGNEIQARQFGLSQSQMAELTSLVKKHAALSALLMEKKGYTEQQANTAILNKIESRKLQYLEKGMSKEAALEKSASDVYSLINNQNGKAT